jgi:hypothetical protein
VSSSHPPGIHTSSVSSRLMRVSRVHPTSRNTPRGGRITAAMNLTAMIKGQVPKHNAEAAAAMVGRGRKGSACDCWSRQNWLRPSGPGPAWMHVCFATWSCVQSQQYKINFLQKLLEQLICCKTQQQQQLQQQKLVHASTREVHSCPQQPRQHAKMLSRL